MMSDVPEATWFYLREGQRIGPMSFSDLKIRALEGQVHPQNDHVWAVGMENWKPAGSIDGLFDPEKPAPPEGSPQDLVAASEGAGHAVAGQAEPVVAEVAWYYVRDGQRIGPVTFADLKTRISEGLVHPKNDQVWSLGMETWKPAVEVDGLVASGNPQPEEKAVPIVDPEPVRTEPVLSAPAQPEAAEPEPVQAVGITKSPENPAPQVESTTEPVMSLAEERALAQRSSGDSQDAWFYTREGERIGPLTFGELKIRVSEGVVHPRTDLVWTVGMDGWKPAGEIDGLFERRSGQSESRPTLSDSPDPYEVGDAKADENRLGQNLEWSGFGRGLYYFCLILLGVGSAILPAVIVPFAKGYEQFLIAIPILTLVISIWLAVKRLNNVGMSGWWVLGAPIPILNFWISYRLYVCPPGYAFHKKLDGVGIFLAILYWLALIAFVLSLVGMFLILVKGAGDPELRQQILDAFEKAQQTSPAR